MTKHTTMKTFRLIPLLICPYFVFSQTPSGHIDSSQPLARLSKEISLEKYLEAISDIYDDPLAFANSIKNENGTVTLYYDAPRPKTKKKKFPASIPLSPDLLFGEFSPPPSGTSISGLNFTTEAALSGFYHIPPDVHGGASPSHLGYVVNTSIDFYTKGGSGVTGYPEELEAFFSSLNPQTDTFDPKIIWDEYENRWVVITLDRVVSPDVSKVYVAVSATADPTGSWYFQSIDASQTLSGNDCWFDYPGFAVDEEAIYITGNYFRFSDNGSCNSSQVLIIDKGVSGGLYAGTVLANDDPASSGGAFLFYDPKVETSAGLGGGLQPAHGFGTMPTSLGTYLVSYSGISDGTNEFIQFYTITNPLSSPSFTHFYKGLGDIDDNLGGGLSDIPQSGSSVDIEANDRRTLNAQWANNALWLCFSMEPASGTNANQVSAYYVKATANGSTSGSVSIDHHGQLDGESIAAGTETWNPAICIDNSGDAAMVYSACSANTFASSYVSLISGSTGAVGPANLLQAGAAAYERTFGGSDNRWGDYASIVRDPSDNDIWAFSQAAISQGSPTGGGSEDGRWGVFIEEFTALVLPVELVSFDVWSEDDDVQFKWSSASEYNCSFYELEYEEAGIWVPIERFSCENTNTLSNYSFMLEDWKAGSTRFRLKQVDYDQSLFYSTVREVFIEGKNKGLLQLVQPNPFSDELTIMLDSEWVRDVTIDVLSSSGIRLLSEKVRTSEGLSEKLLNLSGLKAGTYLLRITADNEVNYKRIIKAH